MSDIDWDEAPEGAEYLYKDNWYKIVNRKLFTHKEKKLHGSFSVEYHWCLSDFVIQIIEKMEPKPESKPVYTQAMVDDGILPSVGMECMVVDSSLANHEYEKCNILFVGVYRVVYTSESCIERFSYLEDVKFKPLTPPMELIDGKAYQFDYRSLAGINGVYGSSDDSFYNEIGAPKASKCTNIKELEVK